MEASEQRAETKTNEAANDYKPNRLNEGPSEEDLVRERRMRGKAMDKHGRRAKRHDEDDEWTPKRTEKKTRRRRDEDEDDFGPDAEYEERKLQRKEQKRKEKKEKAAAAKAEKEARQNIPAIYLPEFINVSNLAIQLKQRVEPLILKMNQLGYENATPDQVINAENAAIIAMEYNYEPIIERADEDLHPAPVPEDKSVLPSRPPVVTIMGHVDHGKTTILDYLRKTAVVATEHGGITQHIGAFSVPLSSGRAITFLDTPGHAAFLSMRARGANVTDIVVLVVAADDSVKPQTIEAIKHANSARVPIIVAINKMDKPEANPEAVKQDLARHEITVEDYGGDTQVVLVSGKTGKGMSDLEEAILLQSEVLDHRAPDTGNVEGWVIEAQTKERGRVATVLVRRGTLAPGKIIVAGHAWARVRSLRNEAGVTVESAGPGMPVEIDGWREPPSAGDEVLQAADEQQAAKVIDFRKAKADRIRMARDVEAINEARRLETERRVREEAIAKAKEEGHELDDEEFSSAASGPAHVSFIIKADVSGSAEAVNDSILSIGNAEVATRVLRSSEGPVSEFDVQHAAAASGHIINFNMPLEPRIVRLAAELGVKILDHNIIYRLSDDVRDILSEKLTPIHSHKVVGEAEIAQVFEIKVKKAVNRIAGCKVRNGSIKRDQRVKVMRGPQKEVVFDGKFCPLLP
jgi:translation initiation factor IF-2